MVGLRKQRFSTRWRALTAGVALSSSAGATTVVGRAIVLHAGADDLGQGGYEDSLATGHAGARIGCGAIAGQS